MFIFKVSRLMDKENKKFRTEAKRAWNQRVRALVDFVKRKDKRVLAWKIKHDTELEEKKAALARKSAEDKALRLKERKKIFESVAQKQKEHENPDETARLKVIIVFHIISWSNSADINP